MKKTAKKIALAFAISTLTTQVVFANSTKNLQSQQNDIEEQIKQAQNNVDNAKESKDKIAAELEEAELEAQKATEELQAIDKQVAQVKKELEEAEKELEIATQKKEQQYENLKDRIDFMYEYGDVGYTQVLFDATDISDFFKRVEYVNTIIQHDKNLLNELEETQNQIDEKVKTIEQKKAETESLQAQQKAKTQELQAKEAAKEKALEKVNADIEAQEEIIYSLEKENAKIEAMVKEAQRKAEEARKAQEAAAKANNTSYTNAYTYTGGQLGWPAPSYTRFSSDYSKSRPNPVTGIVKAHTGIDLATPYGSSIVAAADGVVITSAYLTGYGNTVIIDHGNGLSTLYGHNSSLNVSVGDVVKKGQKIAGAGSTGNSTGNHCHFEVRINGAHTDPKPYLGM